MTLSASPNDARERSRASSESPQDVSERTSLLHSNTHAATPKQAWFFRAYSPAKLIVPVALGARLASMLSIPTTVYILQQFTCRRYWLSHNPSQVPPSGRMPDDMCSIADIESAYAALLASLSALTSVGIILGYNILSYFSSIYGRKPTLLAVLTLALASNLSLLVSQSMTSEVAEFVFLILWQLFEAFSSLPSVAFLANMYVIDVVDAESRSSQLSWIGGWTTLGGALASSIGGLIASNTGTVLNVYRAAAALQALNCLYTWLILPESLSKEKHEELRRRALEARLSGPYQNPLRRIVSNMESMIKPLRHLKPSINPHTGKRNWRLIWCTIYSFLAEVGSFYAMGSMVTYLTTRYKYKPEDAGFLLTIISFSAFVCLTVLVPTTLRLLHPLYERKEKRVLGHEEELNPEDRDTVTGATDHLDVHIAFVSCLIETFGYIFMTSMDSRVGQYAAVVVIGIGNTARVPVVKSLIVATVEPLKQGETLAAVETVGSIGMLLSPLVMGAILTATISTMPALVFYVNGVILTLAASVLFLVKDSDRYQKPRDE